MNHLLIAAPSLERTKDTLDQLEDIAITTLDKDGTFMCRGQVIAQDNIDISLLRLDWDMFRLGHMDKVMALVEQASDLKFVQTSAAGLDNPMFKRVLIRAGAFCNSDAQAPPIAEFTVASVLNHWQRFDERAAHQAARRWEGNSFKEMLGSHWLIVGFGNIGERIARQVKGFGAEVTALRRQQGGHELADRVDALANITHYLPTADVIVLACALNEQTRHLANADFFAKVKSDAVLVNIARGGVVDEGAMLKALENHQLDRAILDVFEQEPLPGDHLFWAHPRISVTPHSSNRGLGTTQRGDELFLANLQNFLAGRKLRNLVDPARMTG